MLGFPQRRPPFLIWHWLLLSLTYRACRLYPRCLSSRYLALQSLPSCLVPPSRQRLLGSGSRCVHDRTPHTRSLCPILTLTKEGVISSLFCATCCPCPQLGRDHHMPVRLPTPRKPLASRSTGRADEVVRLPKAGKPQCST